MQKYIKWSFKQCTDPTHRT